MDFALIPTDRTHAPVIQRLADYPEIATMTPIPHPYPPGEAVRFIERYVLPGRADGTYFGFVMVDADQVVGHIGLKHVDRERGEAEVGYWVGRSYWGRGYASRAVRDIITFAFEELGLRRLYAHVLAHNPASGRVLEKAGFTPVDLPPEAIPDACATKGETLGYELVAGER